MSYGLQVYNQAGQLEIEASSSLTRLFGIYTATMSLITITVGNVSYSSTRGTFNIRGISAIPQLGVIMLDIPGYYTVSGNTITAYGPDNVGATSTYNYVIDSQLTIAVLYL